MNYGFPADYPSEEFPANGGILSSNDLLLGHRKVPAPPSIHAENINSIKLGGNNQKLILFNLGNRNPISSFLPGRTMSSSLVKLN